MVVWERLRNCNSSSIRFRNAVMAMNSSVHCYTSKNPSATSRGLPRSGLVQSVIM
jgi:hypothetical protein